MDIMKKIIELRKQKGITQSSMAEKLGIAPNNYGKIENEKTELSVNRLNQITEILGVSFLELMTGEPQKIEDTGKIREIEDRLKLVEGILKDKEEIIRFKNQEIEFVESHFSKFIYSRIAKKVYEKGYSRQILFNGETVKTIQYFNIDQFEIKTSYWKNTELGKWINVDFAIIPGYETLAINYYLLQEIVLHGGDYEAITVIMESRIIKDNALLIAYEKAKGIYMRGLDEDEEVDENLEIIKKIK